VSFTVFVLLLRTPLVSVLMRVATEAQREVAVADEAKTASAVFVRFSGDEHMTTPF
jgi:hypothetical protein